MARFQNKKKIEYDGHNFQSKIELNFYIHCKALKLDLNPAPEPIEIIGSFRGIGGKKHLPFKYYPDFTITIDGVTFIIETKGENNNTMVFGAGKPTFIDKSAEVNFKHKVIDYELSKKDKAFLVIRHYDRKRADGGFYVEDDLKTLKSLKKKKQEYGHIPHAIERLRKLAPTVKATIEARKQQRDRLKQEMAHETLKHEQFKLEL